MARKTNTTINGKNYFRVTAKVGQTQDGKPIRKQFYGASRKEAEQKRDEYLNKIKKGLAYDFDKLCLGDFMRQWLFTVEKTKLKASSFSRYENIYRVHICKSDLYGLTKSTIKSMHIQNYYNHLVSVGKTPSTLSSIHKLLRKFFSYCVKEEMLIRNPCGNVSLPKDFSVAEKKIEVFTNQEIETIKNEVSASGEHFIFVLALITGLAPRRITSLNTAGY
jgi:hypothetical protein